MQILELKQGVKASTGLNWNGVKYFCTWRINGLSKEPYHSLNLGAHVGDDAKAVVQNRSLLRTSLPAEAVWLNQVHSNKVHIADSSNSTEIATADAVVTCSKNLPLAIMTADCLPVVIASLDASVLAVAHAGWRGLAAGVLENAVAAMFKLAGNKPIQAWIGPAIAADVFQVGAEVYQQFIALDQALDKYFIVDGNGADGKPRYLANLAGIANHKLLKLGAFMVEDSAECTYKKKERYYSYRRDGITGRQVTVAWLV